MWPAAARKHAMSLAQITAWCDARFGPHAPLPDPRPDLTIFPWMIMDSSDAERDFGWRPKTSIEALLDEIASHAGQHPDWLESSGV
jgi:CDP-paratose 2-epimerase